MGTGSAGRGAVTDPSLRSPGEHEGTGATFSLPTGEGAARVVAWCPARHHDRRIREGHRGPTSSPRAATTEEHPSAVSTQPPERPPTRPDRPQGTGTPGPAPKPWSRWVTFLVIAAIAVVLFMTAVGNNDTSKVSLSYSKFTHQVNEGNVTKIDYDPNSGKISGQFKQAVE